MGFNGKLRTMRISRDQPQQGAPMYLCQNLGVGSLDGNWSHNKPGQHCWSPKRHSHWWGYHKWQRDMEINALDFLFFLFSNSLPVLSIQSLGTSETVRVKSSLCPFHFPPTAIQSRKGKRKEWIWRQTGLGQAWTSWLNTPLSLPSTNLFEYTRVYLKQCFYPKLTSQRVLSVRVASLTIDLQAFYRFYPVLLFYLLLHAPFPLTHIHAESNKKQEGQCAFWQCVMHLSAPRTV